MKSVSLLAFDIETYPSRGPDFILGISAHTTSTLEINSTYQTELFKTEDVTSHAEREVLNKFLDYLAICKGGILSSFNLIGFDLPVLITRMREYYPLGLQFSSIISNFSLYDTMIAYRAYSQSKLFCSLLRAMKELQSDCHDCFILNSKLIYSGRDAHRLWVEEKRGYSKKFSTYITEDSHNHLRLAQVLLSSNIMEGIWNTGTAPSIISEKFRFDED